MAKYELSDQVVGTLLSFLNRVDLKGSEAENMVVVKQAFSRPLQKPQPVPKPKPEPKK